MCASAAKQLTATSDWFFIPWRQGQPLTATSDKCLPPQAIEKKQTRSYRHKRLGLEMLHLPRKNSNHPRQFKKKITCGSQNERKNERFYCHKRLGNLTATSEVRAQGTLTCGSCPGTAAASCTSSAWRASCSCRCCWTYRIASGLVINRSGSKPIQDSISLFPVSWNLVIHFWRSIVPQFLCCTSWTAWNGIRTRFRHLWWNEVVEIFWSSWLRPWIPEHFSV